MDVVQVDTKEPSLIVPKHAKIHPRKVRHRKQRRGGEKALPRTRNPKATAPSCLAFGSRPTAIHTPSPPRVFPLVPLQRPPTPLYGTFCLISVLIEPTKKGAFQRASSQSARGGANLTGSPSCLFQRRPSLFRCYAVSPPSDATRCSSRDKEKRDFAVVAAS